MPSYCKMLFVGNVGSDPQMRYTPDGTPVANFSLAVSDWISKNRQPDCPQGWKESYNGTGWELTTWLRVTCWRDLAERINTQIGKGSVVLVEANSFGGDAVDGTKQVNVWKGQDGQPRASFEVVARAVKVLSGYADAGTSNQSMPPNLPAEDPLPF